MGLDSPYTRQPIQSRAELGAGPDPFLQCHCQMHLGSLKPVWVGVRAESLSQYFPPPHCPCLRHAALTGAAQKPCQHHVRDLIPAPGQMGISKTSPRLSHRPGTRLCSLSERHSCLCTPGSARPCCKEKSQLASVVGKVLRVWSQAVRSLAAAGQAWPGGKHQVQAAGL